ncbi:MAG: hypothetical protein ACD_41C00091G0003 [uncultured bacterium]|nr:MAG: hypothetical protein ACD_41C00091G0003 [uncultured bacterium]
MISIVVPVYKCADSLVELHRRVQVVLAKLQVDFELLLVNDGSPDNAWSVITDLAREDKRVIGLLLTRNFGQHYAITAGLQHSRGDWVVVMDGDLQDQPEEIEKLFNVTRTGPYDIIFARRVERLDSWLKRFSSACFYWALSYLTGTKQDATIGNFGIYSRRVIDTLNAMTENLRYFPVLVRWTGFSMTTVDVAHAARATGRSSYNFAKLMRLAFDVIIAFSDKPLRLTVKLGALIALGSFLFVLYVVGQSLYGTDPVEGWASLIVSMWFLAGLIIMILGMIGLYIGKMFDQVKQRPLYLVKTKLNFPQ